MSTTSRPAVASATPSEPGNAGNINQNTNQNLGGIGTPSIPVAVSIGAFAGIFALFIIGFLIAFIRRRNNPARYGPRPAAPGRPRQSKKKGIAMALLESIPIVRFGNNDVNPDAAANKDIELVAGAGGEERASTSSVAGDETAKKDSVDGIAKDENVKADGTAPVKENEASKATGTECAICLTSFDKDEEVRLLPCHHHFHPACIDPWLLNVSGTCPICRYNLQPSQSKDVPAGPEAQEAVVSPEASTLPAEPAPVAIPETHERSRFRSRLRELRAAHTGADYITALRRLHHDSGIGHPPGAIISRSTAGGAARQT